VGTESGLRAVWRIAAGFVPAEVGVGVVDGRLVGPMVLTDVRYGAENLEASVERIELDWQPRALLRGVLAVDYLRAAGVDVVRLPEATQPDDGEPFRLPE